jgi:hypothetical protein
MSEVTLSNPSLIGSKRPPIKRGNSKKYKGLKKDLRRKKSQPQKRKELKKYL